MQPSAGVDDRDVISILAALGRPRPLAATRVLGGADARIWRIEESTGIYALRVLRPEQARVAAREVASIQTAAGSISVPRIESVGVWRDHPALLTSWCDGQLLIDALRATPWRAVRLGLAFGDVQARLHRLSPPPEVVAHTVSWQQWGHPDPALERLLTRIERRPPALLHLDYHPLNLLIAGTDVSGVLDWANARAGDPRADIARTASILDLAPAAGGDYGPSPTCRPPSVRGGLAARLSSRGGSPNGHGPILRVGRTRYGVRPGATPWAIRSAVADPGTSRSYPALDRDLGPSVAKRTCSLRSSIDFRSAGCPRDASEVATDALRYRSGATTTAD